MFLKRRYKPDHVRSDQQVYREVHHELQDPRLKSLVLIRRKKSAKLTIRRHSEPSRKASLAAFTARSTSFYSHSSNGITKICSRKSYFGSVSNFCDNIACSWINHFKYISTWCIDKFIINKELEIIIKKIESFLFDRHLLFDIHKLFDISLRVFVEQLVFSCADAEAARAV